MDVSADVEERARLLGSLGFDPLDALHLAFAEKAEARWFVTTDDRLIKKALERRDRMEVEVVRPDQFTAGEENEA